MVTQKFERPPIDGRSEESFVRSFDQSRRVREIRYINKKRPRRNVRRIGRGRGGRAIADTIQLDATRRSFVSIKKSNAARVGQIIIAQFDEIDDEDS